MSEGAWLSKSFKTVMAYNLKIVTPPSGQASEATAIYQKFLADMEAVTNKHNPLLQYPSSPGQPGTGLLPLANLGVAPGATGHTGYAVQFGKPREADAVKLMAFPKPGTSFERWWDHALDSISSSTSYCTDAYRWALACEKPETTFEQLAESGGFMRLDALLLTSLMECIPGDTHLLRQEIKKAKMLQRKTTSSTLQDAKCSSWCTSSLR